MPKIKFGYPVLDFQHLTATHRLTPQRIVAALSHPSLLLASTPDACEKRNQQEQRLQKSLQNQPCAEQKQIQSENDDVCRDESTGQFRRVGDFLR